MTLAARALAGGSLLIMLAACGSRRPARAEQGDSFVQAGQAHYDDENYTAARAAFSEAVARARGEGNASGEARALTGLGLAEYRLASNLDSAAAEEERAIALWQQLGLGSSAGPSYNALGLIRLEQGRDEDGFRALEQAAEAARASGDSTTLARALGNLALPYAYRGDFTLGRAAARGLRAAGRSRADARWEGNGLTNEAMIDVMIADPVPAVARLDTARRLYRHVAYQTGEQVALGQLAAAFELIGDYGSAFAALDTALTLARGHSLRYEEAVNLRLIADLHARAGDYRRAISQYAEAERILRETGASADLGAALRGTAEAYDRLGNLAKAVAVGEEALRIDRESGERPSELEDLVLLLWFESPTTPAAVIDSRLTAIRWLADSIGTRGARGTALLAEARVADQRDDPARALAAATSLAAVSAGDDAGLAEAHAFEARALAALGRLEPAVVAGRQAVAAIERLRGTLPSEPLAASLAADRAGVYGDLVLALLRLGRQEEAFAVADGGRSRGLLEHLAAVRSGQGAVHELADGEALLRTIDRLMQRLRATSAVRPDQRGAALTADAAGVEADLSTARAAYEALLIRTARRDPKSATLLGAGEASGLDEVRSALGSRQAVVEYFIGPRLVIFVLTARGLAVVERDIDRTALLQQVRLLRDLWGTPTSSWRAGLPTARALHRDLMAPLELSGALAGIDQLYLVPHGILESVPFAALQNEKTGRFVSEEYETSRVPSAAALVVLGASHASPGGVGAIAFAPFPEALPATRREAEAVGARLPGTTVLLGREATESRVRAGLESGAFVHVATHGVFNARNPMFSRVELARGRTSGGSGDGRLEVHEILGVAIRSPFVFFSGCETGAFREWTQDAMLGAGEMGLGQAVLAAGAQDVVSTLWRIDDTGAAVFADLFYANFGQQDAAHALAQAERAMLADGRYSSPYYWAGYVLSGLGRTRPQITLPHP